MHKKELGEGLTSAVFIRVPLTAEVRRVCESSLPLTASQQIYHLNWFWYIGAQRPPACAKIVHLLFDCKQLRCEDLCENTTSVVLR